MRIKFMSVIDCDFSGIETLDIFMDAGLGIGELFKGDEIEVYTKTIPVFMKKIVKKKLIVILYECIKSNDSEIRLVNFMHEVVLYCGLGNSGYEDTELQDFIRQELVESIKNYVEKRRSKFIDLDQDILSTLQDKSLLLSKIKFGEDKRFEYILKSR